MKKVTFLLAAILVLGVSNIVKAQDTDVAKHTIGFTVPNFAILDIESTEGNNITLGLSEANLEAGAEFNFAAASNSDLWLNYTALANAGSTRQVTVSTDKVISGIDLKLQVAAYSGEEGKGKLGTTTNTDAVVLSTTAQTIINGIGSCYTGTGVNKGHNLTYTMAANEYSKIEAGNKSVMVTYTIADVK
ncbi:hypothetical protein [uncultured Draconibacterium sp.]|uniref:hypothetical protein n=1 Tax=uncultured Draconibacterium sp. TaxID=1573823 RepID=UPI0029C7F2C4|nr:hypothetical protein [uncultured Draconibacterium sp.]